MLSALLIGFHLLFLFDFDLVRVTHCLDSLSCIERFYSAKFVMHTFLGGCASLLDLSDAFVQMRILQMLEGRIGFYSPLSIYF